MARLTSQVELKLYDDGDLRYRVILSFPSALISISQTVISLIRFSTRLDIEAAHQRVRVYVNKLLTPC